MSIKFWDHNKGKVDEVKNLNEDEFNGVVFIMERDQWEKRTMEGQEVWVSPKGLKKLGTKGV